MDMQVWLKNMVSPGPKKALPILSFPSVSKLGVTVTELVWDSAVQARGMKVTADAVPTAAAVWSPTRRRRRRWPSRQWEAGGPDYAWRPSGKRRA